MFNLLFKNYVLHFVIFTYCIDLKIKTDFMETNSHQSINVMICLLITNIFVYDIRILLSIRIRVGFRGTKTRL